MQDWEETLTTTRFWTKAKLQQGTISLWINWALLTIMRWLKPTRARIKSKEPKENEPLAKVSLQQEVSHINPFPRKLRECNNTGKRHRRKCGMSLTVTLPTNREKQERTWIIMTSWRRITSIKMLRWIGRASSRRWEGKAWAPSPPAWTENTSQTQKSIWDLRGT